jgi:predicted nucleotidyltransferase
MNTIDTPPTDALVTPGRQLMVDRERLAALCRHHHITRLALFGSRLKGTARPDSDIDLLVDFEPDTPITLFDMARIELELGELLGGHKVDLRTAAELSRYFRDEVLRTAEPQYVAH